MADDEGCRPYLEALSALADGEDAGIDRRMLEHHLAGCHDCRAFRSQLDGLRRPGRIAEAPSMPDLSRRVTKAHAVLDRAGRWGTVRALLGLVATEIIVLSLPALVLGDEANSSAHAARHLGAFSVAYAAGLLVVVARPSRARSLLPVAMVLAGALAVTALIDVTEGRVPLLGEATHLPELLSVLFIWLLARPAPLRPASSGSDRPVGLRIVDPEAGTGDRKTG